MPLQARHIQNYSDAASLEPHWGYVARVLPCTSDAGSCAYLDVVYHSHDLGMMYVGILWATIIGVLFLWMLFRSMLNRYRQILLSQSDSKEDRERLQPIVESKRKVLLPTLKSSMRHYFLPDAFRPIFGRTTRLQVLILSVMVVYLLIWSFVGIHFATWITPIKNLPNVYNTRTSLGPWADRIGVLAYGLTPLSILLSSRESILSLITGVPYHHFNFLHRWLGYVILVQGLLHTISWTVIEARLYQPQPSTAQEWITQTYMIWGCVAILVLTLLWVLSLPIVVQRTGYEFFRKAHYILAMMYIGACWGHWSQLRCFLIPSLVIWILDRTMRLVRSFLLHYHVLPDGNMTYRPSQAQVKLFTDEEGERVVRLDFEQQQQPWHIGQHFYLCFTEGCIWQSHPFTPLSLPLDRSGLVRHSYLFRAKKGETDRIALLAAQKIQNLQIRPTTGVILTGPYGQSILDNIQLNSNVLCIAAGTGITYVLPVLLHLARLLTKESSTKNSLVWIVRHVSDTAWIQPELEELRKSAKIAIKIISTRDDATVTEDSHSKKSKSACSSTQHSCDCEQSHYTMEKKDDHHHHHRPNLNKIVDKFLQDTSLGPTTVFASGPGSMLSDLKTIVANSNSGKRVWAGKDTANVQLVYDDRLEW